MSKRERVTHPSTLLDWEGLECLTQEVDISLKPMVFFTLLSCPICLRLPVDSYGGTSLTVNDRNI